MNSAEAREHLDFNIAHNAGYPIAARTLIDEPSGTYIAVDVSDGDGGQPLYSCDWETGTVILGGSFDDGGCVESQDLAIVADRLARIFTGIGL